jgi:hypothetical protein
LAGVIQTHPGPRSRVEPPAGAGAGGEGAPRGRAGGLYFFPSPGLFPKPRTFSETPDFFNQAETPKGNTMNKTILKFTARNLDDWMTKSMQQTVTIDQKLDLIMFSLKDICVALCTDGSQESIDQFYAPDPAMGDRT